MSLYVVKVFLINVLQICDVSDLVALSFILPLSARLGLARVTNWAFLFVNGLR